MEASRVSCPLSLWDWVLTPTMEVSRVQEDGLTDVKFSGTGIKSPGKTALAA